MDVFYDIALFYTVCPMKRGWKRASRGIKVVGTIFEFHGKRLTLLIGSNEEQEREERKIVATIRTKFLLKVTLKEVEGRESKGSTPSGVVLGRWQPLSGNNRERYPREAFEQSCIRTNGNDGAVHTNNVYNSRIPRL